MNFRVLQQRGLENAGSPFRVVQDKGQEVEWVNRFLDQERVRSVAETTLRSYAYDLLNFLRWWVEVNQTTAISEKAESTPPSARRRVICFSITVAPNATLATATPVPMV